MKSCAPQALDGRHHASTVQETNLLHCVTEHTALTGLAETEWGRTKAQTLLLPRDHEFKGTPAQNFKQATFNVSGAEKLSRKEQCSSLEFAEVKPANLVQTPTGLQCSRERAGSVLYFAVGRAASQFQVQSRQGTLEQVVMRKL